MEASGVASADRLRAAKPPRGHRTPPLLRPSAGARCTSPTYPAGVSPRLLPRNRKRRTFNIRSVSAATGAVSLDRHALTVRGAWLFTLPMRPGGQSPWRVMHDRQFNADKDCVL